MIAAANLTFTVGGQPISMLHGLVSVGIPALIILVWALYALINQQTLTRYHRLLTGLIARIEAIPGFGIDQIPVVAALFENTNDRALIRAIEHLQHDQDILYQQRWLPDPARELSLEKMLSGSRRAALQLRPALTLLSLGLIATLISLLLKIQQPLPTAELAAVSPWPPILIGLIVALLSGIQARTVSEKLRYDLSELSQVIGQRVPVFGQQTGIAQLIDSFFNYDRQMVGSLDRFNATASRLAESDMAEGIRRSVEQVLFESVAPTLREATTLLGDLATELNKRQEQGMADLANRFATAVTQEIASNLGPVNRELTLLTATMADIKNYTDFAIRSMEAQRQNAATQQADIAKALEELGNSRNQFQNNLSSLDQQLARFTEASTRMASTYTSHERTLAETLNQTNEQLKADQMLLSQALQHTTETLAQTQQISTQQQTVLAQLTQLDGTLNQSLTQFANESEAYVTRTMDELDQGLAQIVDRLAFATAEIRDAVEALPAALRQAPNFR
ncbi:MAG: hypothetical protein PHC86_04270 [Eubacteriales bacterium]|nr:hypothetical protein [Eubacteriales bacterium]